MGPLKWFLFVYVLGGLTFAPLCIGLLLAFIYYTSIPPIDHTSTKGNDPAEITRPNDEKLIFKSGTDDLEEKFHRKHDSDVAAGYFAVCREYVPGGVNGKPPDKLSPAGEVVSKESPSVYQSMYRSIFDRSSKATIDPSKDGGGKTVKRPNNVFYVVLRHGHLMLYDDIQQLEVRYVISLDYHDVDIYGGGEEIPEGDLWAKRNSIRLIRREMHLGDKGTSLPFFLFNENMSEKEDFYHALLNNQQRNSDDVPEAEDFDVKHIVNLVQKLHSTEEQLQTRWLNAMIGRLFLALYKTPELEDFIRAKLMKKISRVKKPGFITKLSLLKIDTGTAGPFITNPRLKDLTVNGDCMVEVDVEYTGNFRLEVGATARIDLGKRFGAREVEMVLAVTVKRMQGHALARFKPPPSNRIWFAFEKMPHLEMTVEPIVSSRQITYNIILRQIESRIREVIAESLVLPFWDDFPFLKTYGQKYRGGIWKREKEKTTPVEIQNEVPEDDAEAGVSGTRTPEAIEMMKKEDRNFSTLSMPIMSEGKKSPSPHKTISSINEYLGKNGTRTPPAKPRVLRAPSFAAAIDPKLTANHADTDAARQEGDSIPKRESAAEILKDLSARSSSSTPPGSSDGSLQVEGAFAAAMKERSSSITSKGSRENMTASSRQSTTDFSNDSTTHDSQTRTPTSASNSRPTSLHEDSRQKTLAQQAKAMSNAEQRKQAIASATAAAQKWSNMGWGVLSKKKQAQSQGPTADSEPSSSVPMGRGQPLPPPGQPLPKPPKPTMMSSISSMVPKRKPVLPNRPDMNGSGESLATDPPTPTMKPAPPLPNRRRRQSSRAELSQDDGDVDDVLVVEAPSESAPASPEVERRVQGQELRDDFFGHGEDDANNVPRTNARDPGVYQDSTISEPEELAGASQSRPTAPSLPARQDPMGNPPSYAQSTSQDNIGSKAAPPNLPPRSPTSPVTAPMGPPALPSRETSIKRKPLSRTATIDSSEPINASNATHMDGDVQGGRLSSSPQASEAVNEERRMGMMEGASWGGGYNE